MFGIMILIGSVGVIYVENRGISKNTAIKTEATIINTSNIYGEFEISRKSIFYEYNKNITYMYIDNYGEQYTTTTIYKTLNSKEIQKKYLQGEKIQITYNKNNPEISILGKLNSYFFPHNMSSIIMHILSYGLIAIGTYFCIQKKYKFFKI